MKPISPKMQNMLDSGYQLAPQARLKVDIDPPFVGVDFMADACDPSLYEWGGVLYLSFIDTAAGKLKIGIVDTVAMKVTSLFRVLSVSSARRPHLCFEPSTYAGKPDLPHINYDDIVTGKAMVYREQYDAQGNVLVIYDEIGNGSYSCGIRVKTNIVDFYLSEGSIYIRFQGEYPTLLIDNSSTGETITSFRALDLPDRRAVVVYTVKLSDNTYQVRVAYTDVLCAIDPDEFLTTEITIINFGLPPAGYFMDDQMEAAISIKLLELLSSAFVIEDTLQAQLTTTILQLYLDVVYGGSYTIEEYLTPNITTNQLALRPGYYNGDEHYLQATIATTVLTFF